MGVWRPTAQEVAAYRVLTEATNAVRHSGARHVAIRLYWDDGLHGTVEDDGAGIAPVAPEGVELGATSDRADELGGCTTITHTKTGGTLVRPWLPRVTASPGSLWSKTTPSTGTRSPH